MGCTVLAISRMPDHVHLLVKLPPTVTIARLIKQVKGVSSHFVNETLQPGFLFRWQGRYGAFSISRWDVGRIAGYVRRQKEVQVEK
jgi:REP element-mobilizing transposase RayT